MSNTIANYIEYFRQLASQCYLIRHDPATETNYNADATNRRFAIFNYDEVLTGLRSEIGSGIIFFLHNYNFKGKDNGMLSYKSQHEGAFIIASKADVNDIEEQIGIYTSTEEVVWLMIDKMIYDSNDNDSCGGPFKRMSLNDFTVEPIANIWEGHYGWSVTFHFTQLRNDIVGAGLATDPTKWIEN